MTFSPGEIIRLELIGSLNKSEDEAYQLQDFINPPIIQGISLQGKRVTLSNCLQTQSTINAAGIPSTHFIAHLAFEGVHFSTIEEIKFKGLCVQFHNLAEWFNKRAFDLEYPEKGSAIVTYKQPAPIRTMVGNFHIDFVCLGPNSSSDLGQFVNISQKATVYVWSEVEKPFDEFFPILRHIQNFLSLSMTKSTFVTNVTGTTQAAKEEGPGDTFYNPVNIYYPAAGWQENAPEAHWFDMLFALPDVEEQLEIILRNWINKVEIIKPVYDLYFAALYNPATYPEFEFLSLAQAIETYHRQVYGGKYQPDDEYLEGLYKTFVAAIPGDVAGDFRSSLKNGKLRYANEYSLRKRLQLISADIAGKMNISFLRDKKQSNAFAEKVTATRNYFTHYPPELKDKADIGGQGLLELIEKLRLILQICFLREIGFSIEKISEMFKKSREYSQYLS